MAIVVAAGTHRARAIKPTTNPWGKSKDKGTDFVRLTFKILDGDFAGRFVSWDGYFTDTKSERDGLTVADRTIRSLEYCGCTFPNNDITDLTGVDANEVLIQVEHDKFTDKETNEERTVAKVAWVNSFARGVATELQMNEHDKASFADKMRGKLAFKKAGAPTGSGASSPTNNDDIPF